MCYDPLKFILIVTNCATQKEIKIHDLRNRKNSNHCCFVSKKKNPQECRSFFLLPVPWPLALGSFSLSPFFHTFRFPCLLLICSSRCPFLFSPLFHVFHFVFLTLRFFNNCVSPFLHFSHVFSFLLFPLFSFFLSFFPFCIFAFLFFLSPFSFFLLRFSFFPCPFSEPWP